ncbi:DUF92 domain-containing protein [Bacillus salitolerans]|uniref:DUF92 domain-containing protein n=1 Tax=Bacillus salitolerans TaxID=1437434 RepID=A0ABW4LN89_9BACI
MNSVLLVSFVLVMASIGYVVKSLTLSGFLAAIIVGLLIGIGFNSSGLVLLGVFFASSSLWSKLKKGNKKRLDDILQKGEKRDAIQVLANGLLPAVFSVVYMVSPDPVWLHAFCFSIAAANSDTWASEIGSMSKKTPVHILTLKRVAPGTSGAISLLGTLATIMGALLIGIVSFIVFPSLTLSSILLISFAGMAGSFIDTLIGATIQSLHQCKVCLIETESVVHCNTPTELIRGVKWMNNDSTNFTSILLSVLITSILYFQL